MGYLSNTLDRRVVTQRDFVDAEQIISALKDPSIEYHDSDTIELKYKDGVVYIYLPRDYMKSSKEVNMRVASLETDVEVLEDIYNEIIDPQRG